MSESFSCCKDLFEEIIIITNQRERYRYLGVNVYEDLIPNLGALGGLYTGIARSSFPYSFVIACDMPYLKRPVIEHLAKRTEGYDVIIPKTEDGLEPLHAIYSKHCLEAVEKILE